MSLQQYRDKRDFDKTSEPQGSSVKIQTTHRFVVQEHHASRLHYDFRLEHDGVLKSWAVPKGFPDKPGIRRLAIMTEDHPLEYINFAGTIAKSNYGAGEVSVWDTGEYDWVAAKTMDEGLSNGKLEVILHGNRLSGQFDMIRTDDEKNEWILIKTKHDKPQKPSTPQVKARPTDALTVKSLLEHGARKAEKPDILSLSPMLAQLSEKPFTDTGWQFEIKWDGYRSFLALNSGKASFVSRNHQQLTNKFPEFSEISNFVDAGEAVIDGEIVALDGSGKSHFQALQNHMGVAFGGKSIKTSANSSKDMQLAFMAFDIVYADGCDFTGVPLFMRRSFLKSIISVGGPIRFSDHVDNQGEMLFQRASEMGLEGIMAKKRDSLYVYRRSGEWMKIRFTQAADVVIAGYTESKSETRPFGSLIIAQYNGQKLEFIGHVGTGFDQESLKTVAQLLKPLEQQQCPFDSIPDVNDIPHWTEPNVVCEVKYSNRTVDGKLRHPVIKNIRTDKSPIECQITNNRTDVALGPADKSLRPSKSANIAARTKLALDDLLKASSELTEGVVELDGHPINLTHLNKVFWPSTNTTKRDLLRYYAAVSEIFIAHAKNRPLVLVRYPNGVTGSMFFQHDIGASNDKHPGAGHTVPPAFLRTFDEVEKDGTAHYALCDNLAGLMYLTNLGTIPFHLRNVTVDKPDNADRIIFDLDPQADFESAVQVALVFKSVLDGLGLASFPKTSGANGIHIYVPVSPIYTPRHILQFAKLVTDFARTKCSDLITTERRIKARGKNQVYVDCLQNGPDKTVVAPYSVRATPEAPYVSTPLKWEELGQDLRIEDFTIDTVIERVKEVGDLFEPVLSLHQTLTREVKQ